jgi:hypothetical protein
MLRSLALWLIRWLEGLLDPDYKADLDQWRADKRQAAAEFLKVKGELEHLQARRAEIEIERNHIASEIATRERVIDEARLHLERVKEYEKEKLAEIKRGSDSDALRDPL